VKIWLINPYSTLPGENWRATRYEMLIQTLAEYGHEVTWWTADFIHVSKTVRRYSNERCCFQSGATARLLRTTRYFNNASLGRLLFEFTFARRLREAIGPLEPPDVIVAGQATLWTGLVAARYCRKRGIPLVFDMMDLWPELFGGVIPRPLRFAAPWILLPFYAMRRYTLRRASAVIALAQKNLDAVKVEARHLSSDRFQVIYEGVDTERPPAAWNASLAGERFRKECGETWVVYAGSLGIHYDLKTVLRAAELLAVWSSKVRFFIAGAGPSYDDLQAFAAARGLSNVTILGPLELNRLGALYSVADIGLVPYVPHSTVAMPCKLYDYLAAGLAVVSSLKGELADLIAFHGNGLQYQASDPESLARVLLAMEQDPGRVSTMKKNSQSMVDAFDRRRQYGMLSDFLVNLVTPSVAVGAGQPIGPRTGTVILISPFDSLPGDTHRPGRFADFSSRLLQRGYKVVWFGSGFDHRAKIRRPPAPKMETNPTVIRIPTLAYPSNVCVRREVSHVLFALRASVRLFRALRKERVESVICSFPPVLTPLLCGCVAKLFRVPFVLDVHDAWPEAFHMFLKSNWFTEPIFVIGRLLRRVVAGLSIGATFVSTDYENYFAQRLPPHTNVTALGHPYRSFWSLCTPEWKLMSKGTDEFWVTYIGTISNNYALDSVISGLTNFPGKVRLILVGTGPAVGALSDFAASIGFRNITFTGPLPHADLANLVARSDVGLVSVDWRSHVRLPKKVFDYLAAGIPILTSICGGELEGLISKHGIGACYRDRDIGSFRAALQKCRELDRAAVCAAAQHLAETRFDTTVLASGFVDWLETEVHCRTNVTAVKHHAD
jgi:glycosyltransferase involved in cell wall biosynthesis